MGQRIKVYPGQKFVRLEVIRELPVKNGKRRIQCRCKCGNERPFDLYKVVNGQVKSCGCYGREQIKPMKIRNLEDRVFTWLTVLHQESERDSTGSVMWACRCKCGREVSVSSRDLTSGNTKSCGCLLQETTATLQSKNEQNHTVDGAFVPFLVKKVPSNNVTGYKGVSEQHLNDGRIKYVANITIKGKRIYLGIFDSIEDALYARIKAEELYHKPYIDEYQRRKGDMSMRLDNMKIYQADLARMLGVSRGAISGRVQRGTLPAFDGKDGSGRGYWLPKTIKKIPRQL